MLTFDADPRFLSDYRVVGFEVEQTLGHVGVLRLVLHPGTTSNEPPLADHAALQGCLGDEIKCGVGDDWQFVGIAEALEYDSSDRDFTLVVRDGLSALDKTYASRVYADQTIDDLMQDLIPRGQDYECLDGCGQLHVWMAIQYQESDLSFLKRILNDLGCQIWCSAGKIFAGATPSSKDHKLRLARDIVEFSFASGLGPESAQVTSLEYTVMDRQVKQKPTLASDGYGDLQKSITSVRSKHESNTVFHIVEEESIQAAEHYGVRHLRSRAAGRFRLEGTLRKPVPLGGLLEIHSSELGGNEKEVVEPCLVRTLHGYNDEEGSGSFWRVEAVNPEGLLDARELQSDRLFTSTAIVYETNDDMNRVRVYFPWDPNSRETPWLRVLSPSWGDDHVHYIPPKAGDAVLVFWGQRDMDPVVLGAVAAGDHKVKTPDDLVLLKTMEGHTVTISKKSIDLRNEADGGDSHIEILPEEIVVEAKNGQKVTIGSNSLELDAGGGTSIKLESGKVTISAKQIEISNGTASISMSGLSVSINDGALEIT